MGNTRWMVVSRLQQYKGSHVAEVGGARLCGTGDLWGHPHIAQDRVFMFRLAHARQQQLVSLVYLLAAYTPISFAPASRPRDAKGSRILRLPSKPDYALLFVNNHHHMILQYLTK